jgi:FdhE protein
MPSLAEVAGRLGSLPCPKGTLPEAFQFFQTLWALYPSYSEQWTRVIPGAAPDRASLPRPRPAEPLLGVEDIRFDALPIRRLWERLVTLFEPLDQAGLDPAASGRSFFLSGFDDSDPEVLIGGCLLRPFLYMAARKASSRIDPDGWTSGTCPVCGGAPYHGLIESNHRQRILACGKCHFLWNFQRVRCPFCDNADQGLLGFYYDEEDPRIRIDVCRACNRLMPVTIQEEGSASPLLVYDHLAASHLQKTIERRGS